MLILIKRYKNRKLYDTHAKRYVTLLDISVLIRDGAQVTIIDNDTGNDLTALTLAQIILEQQKNRSDSIPLSILFSLIQRNGSYLLEWLLAHSNRTELLLDWFGSQDLENALVKLNLPTRAELSRLSTQIDALEHKIEALGDTSFQQKGN